MLNKTSEEFLAFYLNRCPDAEGRMIEEIWSWNYQTLEYTHDYIQWLFPLKERSRFNWKAPILNEQIIQAFRTNEQLRVHLKKSLKVMLKFYGLQCNECSNLDVEIIKSDEYQERKANWIELGNHNYLRLTRILTSLSILGLENYAQALFKCLDQIYSEETRNLGSETYTYWKRAIR